MKPFPLSRLLVAFALSGAPVLAQSSGSVATPPRTAQAPDAKPTIAFPISAKSEAAAAQIMAQAKAAGAMLEPTRRGNSIKVQIAVHPLPSREPGHESYDEKKHGLVRTDYDWTQLRTIGNRTWLVGPQQFSVSESSNPSRWSAVRWPKIQGELVDVFLQSQRVWLLSSGWLAEVSPDGSQILSVPHLTPTKVAVVRNLDHLGGRSVARSEPTNFNSVVVSDRFGDSWLGNREAAFFRFNGSELTSVPLSSLGGEFSLIPFDGGLAAFGTAINGGTPVILRTSDGQAWTSRPGDSSFSRGTDGKVAFGAHRFIWAGLAGLNVSADGIIWRPLRDPIWPEATIEVKKADGTYAQARRGVMWNRVIHEGGFFLALGDAFTPGKRHEKPYPKADLAIAALSDDGWSWTAVQLPVPPPGTGGWLATGDKGTFVITPRNNSREVVVLRLSREQFPDDGHPAGRSTTELRKDLEAAVAGRNIPQVARTLVELEQFFPGEETMRISATLRSQFGDLDGAWDALTDLERVVPEDLEAALLRSQVLQGAGRTPEAQAYARWFLAQNYPLPTGNPKTVQTAKLAQCNLMVGAGQWDAAQRLAEAEALRDKTNVEFRLLLAMLHLQRQQTVEAKRWLNEAAALGDPRAKQMLTQLP